MAPKDTASVGAHPNPLHAKLLTFTVFVPPSPVGVENGRNQQCVSIKQTSANLATQAPKPNSRARKNRVDLRDDAEKQPAFLAALNLVPTVKAQEIRNSRTISPSLNQRLRSRKYRVTSYFRNNPVPLSSVVGQKIIKRTKTGKRENLEARVKKYEHNCKTSGPKKRSSPNTTATATKNWPQVKARRLNQVTTAAGFHVHKYSRGRKQRAERLTEIVVGLNKKSLAALNKCQGFDIRVHRMTDEEIAIKIAEVEGASQSLPDQESSSTRSEVTRWTSSQPIPSTSSGIETVATPVIKLWDFMLDASVAKNSSLSKKKLKKRR